jgi:hypothetical protein
MLIILVTWEAEIGRILVEGWSVQIVQETTSPKYPEQNRLEVWLKQRTPALQA